MTQAQAKKGREGAESSLAEPDLVFRAICTPVFLDRPGLEDVSSMYTVRAPPPVGFADTLTSG